MPVHHDDRSRRAPTSVRRKRRSCASTSQKGGFLWADDFWGSYAWEHWVHELNKVLPPSEYQIFELPKDHPLFRQQFQIAKVPQIAVDQFLGGHRRRHSERGDDSAVPHAMGIADSKRPADGADDAQHRFGDAFEREGDDPNYFYNFSVDGYAFGINVLLYATFALAAGFRISAFSSGIHFSIQRFSTSHRNATELARIVDQLEREFDGDPWHGTPLEAILQGIDAKRAAARADRWRALDLGAGAAHDRLEGRDDAAAVRRAWRACPRKATGRRLARRPMSAGSRRCDGSQRRTAP